MKERSGTAVWLQFHITQQSNQYALLYKSKTQVRSDRGSLFKEENGGGVKNYERKIYSRI